jgi:hypothetical protein
VKKTKNRKPKIDQDDMRPEYDFRGVKGVRGKYYQAMRQGYTITIHEEHGTTVVKEVKPRRWQKKRAPSTFRTELPSR